MDADEAMHALKQLGLSVTVDNGRLIVRPAELLDADTRWLIQTYRERLMAELENDEPRWAWLVSYGTHAIEAYAHPPARHAEMVQRYAGAVRITPLPKILWPHDSAQGAA